MKRLGDSRLNCSIGMVLLLLFLFLFSDGKRKIASRRAIHARDPSLFRSAHYCSVNLIIPVAIPSIWSLFIPILSYFQSIAVK